MPEPDGPQWNRPPSPFTAVSGQDEVWNRIMGRDPDDDGEAELSPQDRAFASRHRRLSRLLHPTRQAQADRERTPFGTADQYDEYGRPFSPNYDEPDPFDRSDPEEARQAKAIEDMNETLGE